MIDLRIARIPRVVVLLTVGAFALAACDDDDGGMMSQGIESLGPDFVRAFEQGPNDQPLDASELTLTLTPLIEPFDL